MNNFSDILDFVLDTIIKAYVFLNTTFPFPDLPFSLFWMMVSGSVVTFIITHFFPGHDNDEND